MSKRTARKRATQSRQVEIPASGEQPPDRPSPEPRSRLPWVGKRPRLRFVVVFSVLVCATYAIDWTPLGDSAAMHSYHHFLASASAGVLAVLGYGTTAHGTTLRSVDFSVQIVRGCDAIEPMAVFASAVLASPVRLRMKLPGILAGTACLAVINLIRIVSLFVVGVHFPRAFEVVHLDVWQSIFIVLAVVFWGIWLIRTVRAYAAQSHQPT